MPFAPDHDWEFYDKKLASHHASRSQELTPAEKFKIYDDYYSTLQKSKQNHVDVDAIRRSVWKEKLALRNKQLHYFHAMDESARGKRD